MSVGGDARPAGMAAGPTPARREDGYLGGNGESGKPLAGCHRWDAIPFPGGLPAQARAECSAADRSPAGPVPSSHLGAVAVDSPDPVGVVDALGAGGVLPVPVLVAVDLPGVGLGADEFPGLGDRFSVIPVAAFDLPAVRASAPPRSSVCHYMKIPLPWQLGTEIPGRSSGLAMTVWVPVPMMVAAATAAVMTASAITPMSFVLVFMFGSILAQFSWNAARIHRPA